MSYIGTADFDLRNAELKRMSEAAGLRLPATILPEGTALYDSGKEAQRALGVDVKALPSLSDALFATKARIQLENPADKGGVIVSNVRMNPKNGRVFGVGNDPDKAMGYTKAGFSQLLQTVKPASIKQGFAENLLALPPHIRAQAFEHHAGKVNANPVTLRTIVEPGSGVRVLRAVTSARHSLEQGDDSVVVDQLVKLDRSLLGAKARITRGLDRSDFEIIWPAMDRQLVVGDIALCGVRISNSETKATKLTVEAFVLRVLCANFTVAESMDIDAEELSVRHMGDLRGKLNSMMVRALKRIDPFVQAFGDAYKVSLPLTRAEMIDRVAKRYALGDGLGQSIADSWMLDGDANAGDTLAGLVNAMTRASKSQSQSEGLATEKIAGRLVVEGLGMVCVRD